MDIWEVRIQISKYHILPFRGTKINESAHEVALLNSGYNVGMGSNTDLPLTGSTISGKLLSSLASVDIPIKWWQ